MKTTTQHQCSTCGATGNGKPLAFTLTIASSVPIGRRPVVLRRWFCSVACLVRSFGGLAP